MLLGDKIKQLRIKRGYTQEDVANMLGVSKSTISYYEKNARIPRIDHLMHLANILNEKIDVLLNDDSNVEIKKTIISKEELKIIKELRKNEKIYNLVIENPKKFLKNVEKKLNK